MPISIQKSGRRFYLTGDTYAAKGAIQAAGGHWDGNLKAWWVSKQEVAEKLALEGADSPAPTGLSDETTVVGRGRYKGRACLVVWEGTTSHGPACKLASMDGARVFWAPQSDVQVEKRYRAYEHMGRTQRMTFGRLKQLREDAATAKKQGHGDGIPDGRSYTCEECGERVVRGDGSSCWETGMAH